MGPDACDVGTERVEAADQADVAVAQQLEAGGQRQVAAAALAGDDDAVGIDAEFRRIGGHPFDARHAVIEPGRERLDFGHR